MPRINVATPIRFKCQQGCSSCCKSGGVVLISEEDVAKISKYLKLSIEDFLKRYTKKDGKKIFLIDREINDCIFLEDDKCQIYPCAMSSIKPSPLGRTNLKSEKRWNIILRECPGIGEGEEFTARISKMFLEVKRWIQSNNKQKQSNTYCSNIIFFSLTYSLFSNP